MSLQVVHAVTTASSYVWRVERCICWRTFETR